MLKEIKKESFEQEVLHSKTLSLLQFKTEWSGPCQIIAPVYRELATTYSGLADFFMIDAEQHQELKLAYGIMELPSILFFLNGDVIDHSVGLTSKNALIAKIENALAENK
jgi:thioredoxin 1